jgi:hypothetical protein
VGAQLYELPIRAWHWPAREGAMIPWQRARKVRLDIWSVARKLHAVHAYASQLAGDPQIGLAPILAQELLERMREPEEGGCRHAPGDEIIARRNIDAERPAGRQQHHQDKNRNEEKSGEIAGEQVESIKKHADHMCPSPRTPIARKQ